MKNDNRYWRAMLIAPKSAKPIERFGYAINWVMAIAALIVLSPLMIPAFAILAIASKKEAVR